LLTHSLLFFMKLDERSAEAQFGRSAAPRCRDNNLRTHIKGETFGVTFQAIHVRRKQAAEAARYAQSGDVKGADLPDHEYNESTFPFRQLTNSTTNDTIRIQSTATKLKNDTAQLTAQKSAPRLRSPSHTSFKQRSKQKSSFQSITTQSELSSSLSLSTTNAKAPRRKRLKKSGNGLVPKPLPTIFNEGHTSKLFGLVALPSTTTSTTTATTHSASSLDDISSRKMDTLPSIPTPPDSPVTRSNTPTTASSNAYSAPSDAPFSTPYDEDALLENEVPFPFSKHSGVIIQNMGVKKAKNLNKGKESLLNRHITTVDPHSDPTLPPSLRSLSGNTTDLDLQADISHTTTPKISVAPFLSPKDALGCIHLGPADFELTIAFPQTAHFEVWDMEEEYVVVESF
jgi:hypothetical protein